MVALLLKTVAEVVGEMTFDNVNKLAHNESKVVESLIKEKLGEKINKQKSSDKNKQNESA